MKVKEGYILRKVLDKHLVVPYGIQAKEDKRVMDLTDSAVLLWKAMESEVSFETLVQILMKSYPGISEETIKKDITLFIEKLIKEGYLLYENYKTDEVDFHVEL
jgi:hypothetical protein